MLGDKKIAVFASDWFWSSIPYESLNVYLELCKSYNCDFLMFGKDIRLNKEFQGHEKFYFDPDKFKKATGLKTLDSWDDLAKISSNYDLIILSSHLAPKSRWPFLGGADRFKSFRDRMKCELAVWDIGGADILSNAVHFADHFFTKGPLWAKWLEKMGKNAYTTGTPHYDYYLDECPNIAGTPISEDKFVSKYGLSEGKRRVLVLPSNPGSARHNEQLQQNMSAIQGLCEMEEIDVLIKTYPHDYLFHEDDSAYTGVYKRGTGFSGAHQGGVVESQRSQYQYISDMFPQVKAVESQDHFSAIKYCDLIFNIAGSHVAWETVFTQAKSFSMNYKNKPYFGKLPYLPDYIRFPDELLNHEVRRVEQALQPFSVNKEECSDFISKEHSIFNISKIVGDILRKQ